MFEFDHLPFGARDVDAARDDLARLGFTATATGTCRWTISGRAYSARSISVVFGRGYLDVIETKGPRWEDHLRSSQMYGRAVAPSGIVLSSSSVERAQVVLSERGVPGDDPYKIVREQPGADPSKIDYRIFSLRPAGLPLAVIEDSAPRAMRVPRWLRHPNSATGIARFHLRVPSLDDCISQLSTVLKPKRSSFSGASEFDLGSALLVLHEEPVDEYLTASSRLLARKDGPVLLATEFTVADLEATRACLRGAGDPLVGLEKGIAVDPNAGYGCGMIFREAGRPTSDPG